MSQTFACPTCQARYSYDQVPPGDSFTCGSCQSEVMAPLRAAEQPPSPRTAPRSSARPEYRPGGSPGAARPSAAARHAPAKAKPAFPMVPVAVGAAVLIGVVAFFATGGDDKPAESTTTKPVAEQPKQPQDPTATARTEITRIAAAKKQDSAEACWTAAAELRTLVAGWTAKGRTATEVAPLEAEAERLVGETERIDATFAPLHLARGDVLYADEMLEYANASWLESTEQASAEDLHKSLKATAEGSGGWLSSTRLGSMQSMVAKLAPQKKAWDEFAASGFYLRAQEMAKDTISDLDQRFSQRSTDTDEKDPRLKGKGDFKWSGVVMTTDPSLKPFVFFVQKDESWNPLRVARSRSRSLKALEDIIRTEYGASLNLKPLEDPIPVLLFRNYAMYRKYSGQDGGAGGAYAHFEPMTGRLAVHDDCDHTTIMHEGTHQLMWAWTDRKGRPTLMDMMGRSYWFQEGIAEWYGGASRIVLPSGESTYEIGKLHQGRLSSIRQSQTNEGRKSLFTLRELIDTRYRDKPIIESGVRTPDGKIVEPPRVGQLYAQGWFLIYFMNRFNCDDKGMVHPDQPGKYQAKWHDYVKVELEGKTGAEEFKRCMGFSEADMDRLETEYWCYFDFVQRKVNLNQMKDKDLVPWQQAKAADGSPCGEESDDLLPAFKPENAPPKRKK